MARLSTPFEALVLNTTVLSNFAQAGCVEWLQRLTVPVNACPAVLQEIEAGMRAGRVPRVSWEGLPQVVLRPDEVAEAARLRLRLGAGEAESLAVARLRGWGLATDDRVARRVAVQLGIPLTGTLGILAELVRCEAVRPDEANAALAAMITHGYRAPIQRIEEVLQE